MEKKDVGYMFAVNYAVGQDKNISITGNFRTEAPVEEMTSELDKVFAALEKQRTKRLEYPTALQTLEDQKERLVDEKKKLQALQAKPRLVGAEQNNVKALQEVIARLEEVIPKGEAFVEELRQKAA